MIAFDTNLLVYAHRRENPWHKSSRDTLLRIAEGPGNWGIPWPCIHEFLNVATNPRIFQTPSPLHVALQFIRDLMAAPGLLLLCEGDGYYDLLATLCEQGKIRGSLVHDARIAALCMYHGVKELYSADRDFGRFPGLTIINPLVEH